MKVFGIVGWKNSGKTGLVERLVAEFTARGLRVSTIKHAHHAFDIDHEGTDSMRHRQAGAVQVLLSSRRRQALMTEAQGGAEPSLQVLLDRLDRCDLVLVEGFKAEDIPQIEAHRGENGRELIAMQKTSILAVASDTALDDLNCPVLPLDATEEVADFIAASLGLGVGSAKSSLPPGVDGVPVDRALDDLRSSLEVAVGTESVPLGDASGRVLAGMAVARRDSPPVPNSAVDGYAVACRDRLERGQLVLRAGRAAPGAPFEGHVREGEALRILTGAPLPAGADTVILQEHVSIKAGVLNMQKAVRNGANTRQAGEDVHVGTGVLDGGRVLRAADLALAASVGIGEVEVRKRLRVALMSTGDELAPAGSSAGPAQIFDANRPMLSAVLERWGYEVIDLGAVPDIPERIAAALDRGAAGADAILTSGGASAGDEDHMAALLRESGGLQTWRIAVKPGRPLALGRWSGVPVFGLPGNPVAAFVCTLIFARPALSLMSGAGWVQPQAFQVPAAFRKSKRPGRREFLRARLNGDGHVEVFGSEGSGRISGLSWGDGLVELGDAAAEIRPGDRVRYLPFSGFGL